MARQRKTVQGNKIKDLSRLISLLSLGQWIMITDIGDNKPLHPKFVCHMSLAFLCMQLSGGNVFEVLSERTGGRYLTRNPPNIRLVVE